MKPGQLRRHEINPIIKGLSWQIGLFLFLVGIGFGCIWLASIFFR
jgi:hypothetical protein